MAGRLYLLAALWAAVAMALNAVPVLVMSHRLVSGLKDEVKQPLHGLQDPELVTNMLKKLVTQCSLDIYLWVNVPGLRSSDLVDLQKHHWRHLQNYLHMSLSLVGLPHVEGTLDEKFLQEYIVRTCKAEAVRLDGGQELEPYYDTRKRAVTLDFEPLPETEGRTEALERVDDAIRKLLRATPSPHYTIVITSDVLGVVHPVPDFVRKNHPELVEVFHHATNDPQRAVEVDRSEAMYQVVEPFWSEPETPMEKYLRRKKADEIHLRTSPAWETHRQLVATVAMMVVSLVVFNLLKWVPKQKQL